jgi:hypothetical protein
MQYSLCYIFFSITKEGNCRHSKEFDWHSFLLRTDVKNKNSHLTENTGLVSDNQLIVFMMFRDIKKVAVYRADQVERLNAL